eukprot:scaffold1530_cov98-Cylindrotheca_fusiformis.AAC.9
MLFGAKKRIINRIKRTPRTLRRTGGAWRLSEAKPSLCDICMTKLEQHPRGGRRLADKAVNDL